MERFSKKRISFNVCVCVLFCNETTSDRINVLLVFLAFLLLVVPLDSLASPHTLPPPLELSFSLLLPQHPSCLISIHSIPLLITTYCIITTSTSSTTTLNTFYNLSLWKTLLGHLCSHYLPSPHTRQMQVPPCWWRLFWAHFTQHKFSYPV